MADVMIRTATLDDAAIIVEFNRRLAWESERLALIEEVLRPGVRAALTDEHRGRYFIAELDRQVAGQTMITLEWSDWRNAWIWWIQSVYVNPDFRGRGVFTALYNHVRQLAQGARDVCSIRLYVHHENEAALHRYRRLGMVEGPYRVYEDDLTNSTLNQA